MKLRLLMILVVSLTLHSCFIERMANNAKSKKAFTVENEAIPTTFGHDSNTVLLVILRGLKKYDRAVRKQVENNYHGKYIYITIPTVKNEVNGTGRPLYNKEANNYYSLETKPVRNLKKYRYVFDYALGSYKAYYNSNNGSKIIQLKQFYIYDRLDKKSYRCGAEFKYYKKSLKQYFRNLEKVRQEGNPSYLPFPVM